LTYILYYYISYYFVLSYLRVGILSQFYLCPSRGMFFGRPALCIHTHDMITTKRTKMLFWWWLVFRSSCSPSPPPPLGPYSTLGTTFHRGSCTAAAHSRPYSHYARSTDFVTIPPEYYIYYIHFIIITTPYTHNIFFFRFEPTAEESCCLHNSTPLLPSFIDE